MYGVDVLIPTARFVFSVDDGRVEVLAEHRSPEAFAEYARLRRERPVTGMTTFPNTLLVRGPVTFVIDPGLHLQNVPVLRALEQRGLAASDLAFAALTHAHGDHASALADLDVPVIVHEREREGDHWPAIAGLLAGRETRFLTGEAGELAPGVRWALTPGHTPGGVAYAVDTAGGVVAVCGDIVGPTRRSFDEMVPDGPDAAELLASWRTIRSWKPLLVVAGHLPPFAV
jgi:glyoxylase-like metal-dependent hydrolase (beta-lactamase superfamily II)